MGPAVEPDVVDRMASIKRERLPVVELEKPLSAAEYNANGMRLPDDFDDGRQIGNPILVKHVTADFRARVLPRYGHEQGQHNRYDNLLKLLDEKYGDDDVDTFGPRALEALRDGFLKTEHKDFYLGKHGSPESYARYRAPLVEDNANTVGRCRKAVQNDSFLK